MESLTGDTGSNTLEAEGCQDRIGERWIDALGGVEDVVSPSGEHCKVPFGYDRYLKDATGQIIGFAHSDPEPGLGWEELRRSGTPFEQ